MKSPLASGEWLTVEEIPSTQDLAAGLLLLQDGTRIPGVIQARHQYAGRGRQQRVWHSAPNQALTFSLLFKDYSDHPRPYLINMTVAVAAARTLGVNLRWPNDLYLNGLKVGGILTELHPDCSGRMVAVVGVGINLNQTEFPAELEHVATSLRMQRGLEYVPEETGRAILASLSELPEPSAWSDLEPFWRPLDVTPGKRYRLADGGIAVATGVGADGQLLGEVDGAPVEVHAAEALS